MNITRQGELINVIERAFPATAEILRSQPLESLRDQHPNGERCSLGERRRREHLRLIRKNTRRLRAARLAAGLCRDCGAKRCADSNLFCGPHLKRRRKYARQTEKRKRQKGGK